MLPIKRYCTVTLRLDHAVRGTKVYGDFFTLRCFLVSQMYKHKDGVSSIERSYYFNRSRVPLLCIILVKHVPSCSSMLRLLSVCFLHYYWCSEMWRQGWRALIRGTAGRRWRLLLNTWQGSLSAG